MASLFMCYRSVVCDVILWAEVSYSRFFNLAVTIPRTTGIAVRRMIQIVMDSSFKFLLAVGVVVATGTFFNVS